eukprot:scaffold3980_cov163-Isochrysis_galbana.AAC.1
MKGNPETINLSQGRSPPHSWRLPSILIRPAHHVGVGVGGGGGRRWRGWRWRGWRWPTLGFSIFKPGYGSWPGMIPGKPGYILYTINYYNDNGAATGAFYIPCAADQKLKLGAHAHARAHALTPSCTSFLHNTLHFSGDSAEHCLSLAVRSRNSPPPPFPFPILSPSLSISLFIQAAVAGRYGALVLCLVLVLQSCVHYNSEQPGIGY